MCKLLDSSEALWRFERTFLMCMMRRVTIMRVRRMLSRQVSRGSSVSPGPRPFVYVCNARRYAGGVGKRVSGGLGHVQTEARYIGRRKTLAQNACNK